MQSPCRGWWATSRWPSRRPTWSGCWWRWSLARGPGEAGIALPRPAGRARYRLLRKLKLGRSIIPPQVAWLAAATAPVSSNNWRSKILFSTLYLSSSSFPMAGVLLQIVLCSITRLLHWPPSARKAQIHHPSTKPGKNEINPYRARRLLFNRQTCRAISSTMLEPAHNRPLTRL